MNIIPQALTIIGAVILAIHLLLGRVIGYGSFDANDVTAIFALAVAIRLVFARQDSA